MIVLDIGYRYRNRVRHDTDKEKNIYRNRYDLDI